MTLITAQVLPLPPPRRPPFLPGFLCVWAAAPAQNTAGCFGVSWLTA